MKIEVINYPAINFFTHILLGFKIDTWDLMVRRFMTERDLDFQSCLPFWEILKKVAVQRHLFAGGDVFAENPEENISLLENELYFVLYYSRHLQYWGFSRSVWSAVPEFLKRILLQRFQETQKIQQIRAWNTLRYSWEKRGIRLTGEILVPEEEF